MSAAVHSIEITGTRPVMTWEDPQFVIDERKTTAKKCPKTIHLFGSPAL
jgi:hypothetical protein